MLAWATWFDTGLTACELHIEAKAHVNILYIYHKGMKAPDLCYMLFSDLVELIFKRSDTLTDIRTDFGTILTPE